MESKAAVLVARGLKSACKSARRGNNSQQLGESPWSMCKINMITFYLYTETKYKVAVWNFQTEVGKLHLNAEY